MIRRRAAAAARRVAVWCIAAALSTGAMAGEASAGKGADNGFVAWVRSVGRAIGMAFRDLGSHGKEAGLAVGHGAAKVGKEIGHGAADAGKQIGQAAKQGAKSLRNALTGKGSAD